MIIFIEITLTIINKEEDDHNLNEDKIYKWKRTKMRFDICKTKWNL